MKKISALILGAALCAAGAQAATVSSNFSFGSSPTELNKLGSLHLFDSSLGTLTGVKLTLTGFSDTSLNVTNNASGTQDGLSVSTSLNMKFNSSIDGLDALYASTALGPGSASSGYYVFTLSSFTDEFSLAAGGSRTFGPLHDQEGLSFVSANTALLSSLTGGSSDTFTIACKSQSGLTVWGGGGNVAATQTTTAGCGATIEYTYATNATPSNQTPEPASLALVGMGLIGVAASRRKSRQA